MKKILKYYFIKLIKNNENFINYDFYLNSKINKIII